MSFDKLILCGIVLSIWLVYSYVLYPFFLSPFAHVPGPKLAAMSSWWIRWVDFSGHRAATIDSLHREYGKIVRVGPNELTFTGFEAMQKIYGAGSAFSKPEYFYNIFIAYLSCTPYSMKLMVAMDIGLYSRYWTMQLMRRGKSYLHRCIRNHS